MPSQKTKRERFIGWSGFVLLLTWIGQPLDQIGRVQLLIQAAPRLETWWAHLMELIGALFLFIWATQLEQEREKETAPRIFLPGGGTARNPGIRQKIRHQWFWAKLAATAVICGLIVIGAILGYKFHYKKTTVAQAPKAISQTLPVLATPPKPKAETKSVPLGPHQGGSSHLLLPAASPQQPAFQSSGNGSPGNASGAASSQNSPTTPIPANAPLTCPPLGALAEGWSIYLQQMIGGAGSGATALPIENGPINFKIMDPDQSSKILHPLLLGKVATPPSPLRGSQLEEAEALLEDIKTQLGAPEPLTNRPAPKLERFVYWLDRRFQTSESLTVSYADGTRGSSDAVRSGNKSVAITSLSSRSQAFINKLDAKAKADADQSCKDALKNLTQEE